MNHEKIQQNIKWMHVDILLPHWFSIFGFPYWKKSAKVIHITPSEIAHLSCIRAILCFVMIKLYDLNIEFITWATECNSGEQKELMD